VVEDNPINQRVATELLNLGGIVPDVVDNGVDAIAAASTKHYDLVLMDIQMPGMDGREATQALRKSFTKKDLPIIALTAHTMSGDRERCIAAGMNDFVSKPINPKALFEVIGRNIARIAETEHAFSKDSVRERQTAPPAEKLPGMDIEEGLVRLGRSWELYVDILESYCDHYRNAVAEFTEMLSGKDYAEARKMAHSLKGASGNVSATDLRNAAEALEIACSDGDDERAWTSLKQIDAALAQVVANVEVMKASERVT